MVKSTPKIFRGWGTFGEEHFSCDLNDLVGIGLFDYLLLGLL